MKGLEIQNRFVKWNYDDVSKSVRINERVLMGDDMNSIRDLGYGNPRLKNNNDFHGTHVAGIIAARNGVKEKVVGIVPGIKIMGLKVIPKGGRI